MIEEAQDLEQEIRESQIEMIHMEEDEQKRLQSDLEELHKEVTILSNKQQQIEGKAHAAREEARLEREQQRQKKLAAQKARQELVQDKVLEAFCDYGSTLRSLPAKEKITLIFEDSSKQDTIMVFDQKEVTACERGEEGLRDQAISYLF